MAWNRSARQRAGPGGGNSDPPPTASRYSQMTGLSNSARPSSVTRHGTRDSGFAASRSGGEACGLVSMRVIWSETPQAKAQAMTLRT